MIYTKILSIKKETKNLKSDEAFFLNKAVCTSKNILNFYNYVTINMSFTENCLVEVSRVKLNKNDQKTEGLLLFQFQLALKQFLSQISRDSIMKINFEILSGNQKSITIMHSAHNFPGYDINNFASELSNKNQYNIIISACKGKIMNFDYSNGKRFDLNLEDPKRIQSITRHATTKK